MDCTTATEAEFYRWLNESVGRGPNLDRFWFAKDLKDRFQARLELSRLLYSGGWLGRAWPSYLGGQNRTLSEQISVYRAFASAGLPTVANWVGLEIVGPVLLKWGTDEQKRSYLPRIVRGEDIWCQALTEQGAGSDLAKIATTATRSGDQIILSGEKIWISWAAFADFALVLARSNPLENEGQFTFLIVNLRQQGVTVEPILAADGECEDCTVRFRDVCLPSNAVLGHANDGWKQLKTSLLAARGPGTFLRVASLRGALRNVADAFQDWNEFLRGAPQVATEFASLLMQVRALEALGARACAYDTYDDVDPLLSAAQKLTWARVSTDVFWWCLTLLRGRDRRDLIETRTKWAIKEYFRSLGCHIEGGTDEVQHNFIARRLYAKEINA